MTIIIFLIDNSASMNQRVFLGGRPTLLDVAKSAVETFVKVRQRSLDSRQDRYMLLTFEEPPSNIKAGWKENLATFMSELKNLQAHGLTTLGNALRHTFDVLNVNRMQHGIDTYGQGKCPFYLEPSLIVCITDGGILSSNSGVQEELKMHGSSPGFELTREPFRWDQRLFSLVLRMTGQPSGDREIGLVPSDNSAIDVMCEVTGGRSYAITTHRMLHQCIDSLVQKVQAGVVVNFEKYGPDPPIIDGLKVEDEIELIDEKNGGKLSWHNVRRMIYVPRSNQKGFAGGFWPIPESYWPDQSLPTLPSRTAHPNIKFMCQPSDPMVVENFPFDKYELEPSPLTQFIIGRKQPGVCWQVYIANSSRNNAIGFAFGYLKASTNLTSVNLFVMPYNYPILLPLVDELFRVHRLKPTSEWRAQFAMYLSAMPPYYAGPLKRALLRMGAGNVAQSIPEENYLSYSVLNYLKKLKTQAKTDYDRTCNEVAVRVKASEMTRVVALSSFKNPFDIPRQNLLDQLARIRTLFLRPCKYATIHHESLHNMPVGQMGNYQEYLKRMPHPLRELESAPVRQHMFGNPFKIDKRMIIDEADIDLLGQGKSSKKETNNNTSTLSPPASPRSSTTPTPANNLKRKAGPLPKDFRFTPYKLRKTKVKQEDGFDFEHTNYSMTTSSSTTSSPSPPASPQPQQQPKDLPTRLEPHLQYPHPNTNDKENSLHFETFGSLSDGASSILHPFYNEDDDDDDDEVENEIQSSTSNSFHANDTEQQLPIENGNGSENEMKATTKELSEAAMVFNSKDHVVFRGDDAQPAATSIPKNKKIKKEKGSPLATPAATYVPTAPQPEMDDEKTRKKNLDLRVELFKEIRRPILRLDYVLSQLSNVSGSYDTKLNFIKCLAREALRFKRKRLAKAIDAQAEMFAPFIRPSAS